jgi:hypothetical protein
VSQSRAVVNKMLRNTPPRQVVDGGWGGHAEAPTVFVDGGAKQKSRRFLWMGSKLLFAPTCEGGGTKCCCSPSWEGGKKSCLPLRIFSAQNRFSTPAYIEAGIYIRNNCRRQWERGSHLFLPTPRIGENKLFSALSEVGQTGIGGRVKIWWRPVVGWAKIGFSVHLRGKN